MNLAQILVLAVVQGLAELLPVSSSADVIVAEKLMGLDPTAPEMIASTGGLAGVLGPSVLGMLLSFVAGLMALRWLSRWREQGRWHLFGVYCVLASCVVLVLG
jgi:undecaprenyl pyrophosphate phosphatase UppP